ncbi:MAG: (2Fe-2S)-binding protein [Anaerolineales bacterium]|jgi:aerobic-type carbon monoxide dehydrogenase small subunit (CoxS/CutS family)
MAEEEKVPTEETDEAEEPLKISRRDFLVGIGAGAVVTGAVAVGAYELQPPKVQKVVETVAVTQAAPATTGNQPSAPAAPEKSTLLEGPQVITLKINEQDYTLAVEPQATLADVLRRDLGLTGTHIGCNGSYCSACTVIVDGVAQNSCSLLAIREAGKQITTIEGLEKQGKLHPVQQAFWDNMGYQCGFCTSGQIMRTMELLNKVKNPSEDQIRRHMSGNMCKCSAYPNIVTSVQKAAEAMA